MFFYYVLISSLLNLLLLVFVMASRSQVKQDRVIKGVKRRSLQMSDVPSKEHPTAWSLSPPTTCLSEENGIGLVDDDVMKTPDPIDKTNKPDPLSILKTIVQSDDVVDESNGAQTENYVMETPEKNIMNGTDDGAISKADDSSETSTLKEWEHLNGSQNYDDVDGELENPRFFHENTRELDDDQLADTPTFSHRDMTPGSSLRKSVKNLILKVKGDDYGVQLNVASTPVTTPMSKEESRIKIFPLNSESFMTETPNHQSEDATQSEANLSQTSLNDLSMDHLRTPGNKIKIFPNNIDHSFSDASSISNTNNTFNILDESNHGSIFCDLCSGQCSKSNINEPLAPPPGYKLIATTMEIGLVRDVVFQSVHLHEMLLKTSGVIGISYALVFCSGNRVYNLIVTTAKTAESVAKKITPGFVAKKVYGVQMQAWKKWARIDGAVAEKISDHLQAHPFLRQSIGDMYSRVRRYKTYQVVEGTAVKIISMFKKPEVKVLNK